MVSSITAATAFLTLAGPAHAINDNNRPLAGLADATPPVAPPSDSAIETIEAVNRSVLAEPTQWAGAWYDRASGQVVTAVPTGATERTRATARSSVGSKGAVVSVGRSFADLARISDEIMERRSVASVPIVTTGMDWEHNAVVVGLETITDDARAVLAADYGDTVTVRQVPQATRQDGPDRWRDRYPYWGGSAWGNPASNARHCSTAFPMRRPDRSKKFLVTAGHCNSPNALDAATLNTDSTSWNNVIGTSKGYLGGHDDSGQPPYGRSLCGWLG